MESRHVSYSNFILYTETDQYIHADVMVAMRFRAMPSVDTFSNMCSVLWFLILKVSCIV